MRPLPDPFMVDRLLRSAAVERCPDDVRGAQVLHERRDDVGVLQDLVDDLRGGVAVLEPVLGGGVPESLLLPRGPRLSFYWV